MYGGGCVCGWTLDNIWTRAGDVVVSRDVSVCGKGGWTSPGCGDGPYVTFWTSRGCIYMAEDVSGY